MRGMGIETRRNTHRRDSVGLNIILGALERKRLGEADKAHLCRAIVGLTKVAYGGKTTANQIIRTTKSYRTALLRWQC